MKMEDIEIWEKIKYAYENTLAGNLSAKYSVSKVKDTWYISVGMTNELFVVDKTDIDDFVNLLIELGVNVEDIYWEMSAYEDGGKEFEMYVYVGGEKE